MAIGTTKDENEHPHPAPEYLRFMQQYYRAVFGLGLIFMMVFMRSGIISALQKVPWARSHATGQEPE